MSAITRSEAVTLLGQMLRNDVADIMAKKDNHWHIGVQELRVLLDAIYGGPPQTVDEELYGHHIATSKRREDERMGRHWMQDGR